MRLICVRARLRTSSGLSCELLVSKSHKSHSSPLSQSHEVPTIPTKSHKVSTIETKVINKIRRNKKGLVIAEINRLLTTRPEMDVIEICEDVVGG